MNDDIFKKVIGRIPITTEVIEKNICLREFPKQEPCEFNKEDFPKAIHVIREHEKLRKEILRTGVYYPDVNLNSIKPKEEMETKTFRHSIAEPKGRRDRYMTYEIPSDNLIKVEDRYDGAEPQIYTGRKLLNLIKANPRDFKHCNYDPDSLMGLTLEQKKRKQYSKTYRDKKKCKK